MVTMAKILMEAIAAVTRQGPGKNHLQASSHHFLHSVPTSTWVRLEYNRQSSARVNSEFVFILRSRNCNWGCVRWTNRVCPYIPPGDDSWAVWCARGLPPLMDTEHMGSWITQPHSAVLEQSASVAWEAEQISYLSDLRNKPSSLI